MVSRALKKSSVYGKSFVQGQLELNLLIFNIKEYENDTKRAYKSLQAVSNSYSQFVNGLVSKEETNCAACRYMNEMVRNIKQSSKIFLQMLKRQRSLLEQLQSSQKDVEALRTDVNKLEIQVNKKLDIDYAIKLKLRHKREELQEREATLETEINNNTLSSIREYARGSSNLAHQNIIINDALSDIVSLALNEETDCLTQMKVVFDTAMEALLNIPSSSSPQYRPPPYNTQFDPASDSR